MKFKVHSWELVTAVDGPGTRLDIFFQGCPLRCQFCHNPDTWLASGGKEIDTSEVIEKTKRYKHIFDTTEGGITLTGGEVLMQADAAREILQSSKKLGVHTCLDTSGAGSDKLDTDFIKLLDLVLLDIKGATPEIASNITRTNNYNHGIFFQMDSFARKLLKAKVELRFRYVLLPKIPDEQLFEIKTYVTKLENEFNTKIPIDILPFHQMGTTKYENLNLPYVLKDLPTPSKDEILHAKKILNNV
ncbi:MAG: radical SAM protein [Candidatus Ancillula sp.]|jgi:pyruvate formate lyase activating enzyme|nr:radical SAM protein [Candidatus Ancillula sp.]